MSLGSDTAHAHCAEQSCDCSRDTPVWLLENMLPSCEGEWSADTGIQCQTGAAGPLLWAAFSVVRGSAAQIALLSAQAQSFRKCVNLDLAPCKSGRCLRNEPGQRTAPCLFLLPLSKVRLSHGLS